MYIHRLTEIESRHDTDHVHRLSSTVHSNNTDDTSGRSTVTVIGACNMDNLLHIQQEPIEVSWRLCNGIL